MHDRQGNLLRKGDYVLILARVEELTPGEDYCNVTVETVHGRRPDGQRERISAINTAVLDLAEINAHPHWRAPDIAPGASAIGVVQ